MPRKTTQNSNLHRLILEASGTNDISPEVSFVQDLKRVLTLENPIKPFATKFYKPSSMQCMRMMFYQMTGVEKDKKEKSPLVINMGECGSDRHKRIQGYIKKMSAHGIQCEFISVEEFIKQNNLTNLKVLENEHESDDDEEEFETLVYDSNLSIKFKCDGILKYNNKYYVLEIKTEVSYNWQSRTEVAQKHRVQACSYSYAFGINDVLFLYENRDICEWKGFMLHVTPEMKLECVINRIKVCNKYIESNNVPPISLPESKEACKFCDYKNTCKRHGKTDVLQINYDEL